MDNCHSVMWIKLFGYVVGVMYLCVVRSGSVERAGTNGQLKESEVGCLDPTPNVREPNTKVRLLFHINKFIFVGDILYLRVL